MSHQPFLPLGVRRELSILISVGVGGINFYTFTHKVRRRSNVQEFAKFEEGI